MLNGVPPGEGVEAIAELLCLITGDMLPSKLYGFKAE
jgi:hypothetical protein